MKTERAKPVAAKAGERTSLRAVNRLRKLAHYMEIDPIVQPKGDELGGQWFCIDCGELPPNNFSAWGHVDDKPKHRLAWLTAGRIEEP